MQIDQPRRDDAAAGVQNLARSGFGNGRRHLDDLPPANADVVAPFERLTRVDYVAAADEHIELVIISGIQRAWQHSRTTEGDGLL